MELNFKTDLNCGSCVSKVKPFLDAEASVQNWAVDTKDPRKVLTVTGIRPDIDAVKAAVAKAGFHVLGPLDSVAAPKEVSTETYRPLILIFCYLLVTVLLLQYANSSWDVSQMMTHFMGGFFLVFSFFKFLNLQKFADAYATYDIVAKRVPTYGLLYPFIELFLGIAYLSGFHPNITNTVTLVVMGVSTIGVAKAVANKRKIECACLGTVFNLPMTKVTLFEDLLMVVMAGVMLLQGHV